MRKRLLSAMLLTGMAGTAYGQQAMQQNTRTLHSMSLKEARTMQEHNAAPTESYLPAGPVKAPTIVSKTTDLGLNFGTQIGRTTYDLPTNSYTPRRVVVHDDGTISTTWTFSDAQGTGVPAINNDGFNDRGAGYNYFDGSTWVEGVDGVTTQFGVSTERIGWPDIVKTADNSELIIAHGGSGALRKISRPTKGTGNWTTDLLPTELDPNDASLGASVWTRLASAGEYVYAIASNSDDITYNDLDGTSSIFFYRSTDNGETWDIQDGEISALTAEATGLQLIGGDSYAITARDSAVAIVLGSGNAMALLKSMDYGNTWKATPVYRTDTTGLPRGLNGTDTIFSPVPLGADAGSVVLDNNLQAHVVGDQLRLAWNVNEPWGGSFFFPPEYDSNGNDADSIPAYTYADSIGDNFVQLWYWNEYMTKDADTLETGVIIPRKDVIVIPLDADGNGTFDITSTPADEINNPEVTAWTDGTPLGTTTYAPGVYGGANFYQRPALSIDPVTNDLYLLFDGMVEDEGAPTLNTGINDDVSISSRTIHAVKGSFTALDTNLFQVRWQFPTIIPSEVAGNVGGFFRQYESVYASSYPLVVDGTVHFTFMSDFDPGISVQFASHGKGTNFMGYYALDVSALDKPNYITSVFGDSSAVTSLPAQPQALASQVSVYPNPATDRVSVAFSLEEAGAVRVSVRNLLGQEVVAPRTYALPAGESREVSLDLRSLAKGLYICVIEDENGRRTAKRFVRE